MYADEQVTIVSEGVVNVLIAEKFRGFRTHQVRLRHVEVKNFGKRKQPKYFSLEITGCIDMDIAACEILLKNYCPVCFAADRGIETPRFVPVPGSWDGSDLFVLRNYPSGFTFCTEKLILLARKHRWIGFRFDPMDVPSNDKANWTGIDYLGKKWPPDWYPSDALGQLGKG